LIAFLMASPALAVSPETVQVPQPGEWSAAASYLWPGEDALANPTDYHRNLSVRSPDGRLAIEVGDVELRVVTTSGDSTVYLDPRGVSSLAEVLWAQDSQAVFVTESDGGSVGTWSITVLRFSPEGVEKTNPGSRALADFKQKYPNCPDEYPNVAGVGWLHESQDLLLIVEMPCHSSCQDMCKFLGYIVNPDNGKIKKRLNANEVRARFRAMIGPRLRERP
jgi:hypothetical protein